MHLRVGRKGEGCKGWREAGGERSEEDETEKRGIASMEQTNTQKLFTLLDDALCINKKKRNKEEKTEIKK